MPPADQIHDPGLQQERTVLAWDRTGLALMVAAGLLVRSLGGPLLRSVGLIPLAGFTLGLVVVLMNRRRYVARWRNMQRGGGMVSPNLILATATGTVLLGLTALISVFLGGA